MKCIVAGCNYTYRRKTKSSFFGFPNDPDLRRRWLEVLNISSLESFKTPKICCVHFHDRDFIYSATGKRLLQGSIPSIKPVSSFEDIEVKRIAARTQIKSLNVIQESGIQSNEIQPNGTQSNGVQPIQIQRNGIQPVPDQNSNDPPKLLVRFHRSIMSDSEVQALPSKEELIRQEIFARILERNRAVKIRPAASTKQDLIKDQERLTALKNNSRIQIKPVHKINEENISTKKSLLNLQPSQSPSEAINFTSCLNQNQSNNCDYYEIIRNDCLSPAPINSNGCSNCYPNEMPKEGIERKERNCHEDPLLQPLGDERKIALNDESTESRINNISADDVIVKVENTMDECREFGEYVASQLMSIASESIRNRLKSIIQTAITEHVANTKIQQELIG